MDIRDACKDCIVRGSEDGCVNNRTLGGDCPIADSWVITNIQEQIEQKDKEFEQAERDYDTLFRNKDVEDVEHQEEVEKLNGQIEELCDEIKELKAKLDKKGKK